MKTLKNNDKGFSLIELIITIAIIALVVVPVLNSFFLAQDVNSEARLVQNATTVAQDIMEEFKAKSIEDMTALYTANTGNDPVVSYTDAAADSEHNRQFPKYEFKGWKCAGADGEDFYVDITLDSEPYTDAGDKYGVNSMTSPQFSSLFGSDVVMLFKQYMDPDYNLDAYFRATGALSEEQLATLGPSTVSKSTVMNVICSKNNSTGEYTYKIVLDMTYTLKSDSSKSVTVTKEITKNYPDAEGHSIYMMLPVYDNANTSNGTNSEGNYYSTDKFTVKYDGILTTTDGPQMSLFIAEQETTSAESVLYKSVIDSRNVSVATPQGTKTLYNYVNNMNNFKIYTNIKKSNLDNSEASEAKGLTYSDKSDDTLMYEITVNVRYDDPESDEIIATFSSSKED